MEEQARLTVLGSGTLLPDARRRSAGFHLAIPCPGRGEVCHRVLMDCGTGTLHGLAEHGVDWRGIDTVVLSHYHTDHVGDLAALFGAWRYDGRTRPLSLLGPRDLPDYLHRLAAVAGRWITDPGFPLDLVPLDHGATWTATDGALEVRACSTPHTDVSLAFRLSGSWGALGYSGDTGPSGEVGRFLRGCELLIAECAVEDPPPVPTHLSPRGVAQLAREAEPRLLLLTHVYPPGKPEAAAEAVSRGYDGEVRAAWDGMSVELGPGRVSVDPARRAV